MIRLKQNKLLPHRNKHILKRQKAVHSLQRMSKTARAGIDPQFSSSRPVCILEEPPPSTVGSKVVFVSMDKIFDGFLTVNCHGLFWIELWVRGIKILCLSYLWESMAPHRALHLPSADRGTLWFPRMLMVPLVLANSSFPCLQLFLAPPLCGFPQPLNAWLYSLTSHKLSSARLFGKEQLFYVFIFPCTKRAAHYPKEI